MNVKGQLCKAGFGRRELGKKLVLLSWAGKFGLGIGVLSWVGKLGWKIGQGKGSF